MDIKKQKESEKKKRQLILDKIKKDDKQNEEAMKFNLKRQKKIIFNLLKNNIDTIEKKIFLNEVFYQRKIKKKSFGILKKFFKDKIAKQNIITNNFQKKIKNKQFFDNLKKNYVSNKKKDEIKMALFEHNKLKKLFRKFTENIKYIKI